MALREPNLRQIGMMLVVALIVGVLGLRVWRAVHGRVAVSNLQKLTAADVISIRVLEGQAGLGVAREFTDRRAVDEFVKGLRDATFHYPSHPGYGRQWRLLVNKVDGQTEMICSLASVEPDYIYCDLVRSRGNTHVSVAQFKSKSLRGWFREHVE